MINFLNKGEVKTFDATAEAADIISPKTAYVNGKKITGTIGTVEKTVDVSDYFNKTIGNYELSKFDTYVYNDYIILGFIEDSNLVIQLYKDNAKVKEKSYPIADNFDFTTVHALAINKHSITDTSLIATIGITCMVGGRYDFNFKQIVINLENNSIELTGNISTSLSLHGGVGGTIYSLDETADRFYTIMKYNSDDYLYTIEVNWDSNTTTNKYQGYHGGYYAPYATITGNTRWLSQNSLVSYLDPVNNTTTSYGAVTKAYISPSMKYMCYNGALYKITDNTNFNTIVNNATKIENLTYNKANFSKNDTYLCLEQTGKIAIYRINSIENTIELVQEISGASYEYIYNYNCDGFFLYNKTTKELHLYYFKENASVVDIIIYRDTKYVNIPINAVPSAANVMAGNKYRNSNGNYIVGTMPNNGTLNYTPTESSQSIPAGYTAGGTVSGDANLIAGNIKGGVSIFGITGTFGVEQLTGSIVESGEPINPSASVTSIDVLEGNYYALAINAIGDNINATITGGEIISDTVWNNLHAGNIKIRLVILKATAETLAFSNAVWLVAQGLLAGEIS